MLPELIGLAAATATAWYAVEKRKRRTGPVAAGLHPEIELPFEEPFELYHNDLSLCSKKVRLCLAELGIPYRSHHVELIETGAYETLSPGFLRVNPRATVPVLVHHGHPVYESHEMIVYAAEHCGRRTTLLPDDPAIRARMQRWIDRSSILGDNPLDDLGASAGNCIPALTFPLFAAMIRDIPTTAILEGLLFHWHRLRPVMFLAMKAVGLEHFHKLPPLDDGVRLSRRAIEAHFDALEAEFARHDGPWILGADFTLADVSWAVIFDRLREAEWTELFPSPRWPHLAAYWDRLRARDSYRSAILEHQHPTVLRGAERIVAAKRANAGFRRAVYGIE